MRPDIRCAICDEEAGSTGSMAGLVHRWGPRSHDFTPRPKRFPPCGTRAVEQHGPDDFRVVCATCDGGGTVRHRTREAASHAATRDSAKPCPARPSCGAR